MIYLPPFTCNNIWILKILIFLGLVWKIVLCVPSINQGKIKPFSTRGGVESNRTNFEFIFLEFFELKKYFRINRIQNFSNRTNQIILPSNRISNFQSSSFLNFFELFRIFSNIFFQQIANKKNKCFQIQTFLGKHVIWSSSLEKKDQNTVEIVLKITNCGSKDS